jgi:hypothetical protein
MELRARIRPLARRAAMTAALGALLVPAAAGTATADAAKRKKKSPVVTSVRPMEAFIGETVEIRGRHFLRGRNRNSVVFKRDGGRAIFVKADVGTTKLLRVKLPDKLASALVVKDGTPVPTRLRVRVLAAKFGKAFTSLRNSPVIGPEKPPAPATPPASQPDGDCDADGLLNKVDSDDDNDLLADGLETQLKLDGCKRDSDGDAVEDGYEYRSAQDLNDDHYQNPDTYLPYPSKKPYPNPLFGDANVDYDGDGLTLVDEYTLWLNHGMRSLEGLLYSDGEQYSQNIDTPAYPKHMAFLAWSNANGYAGVLDVNTDGTVTDVERYYFDFDYDGKLSDDERDEDADGLSNWVEAHGYLQPSWWAGVYDKEKAFTVPYAGTDLADADTDGDGVRDGADDQDHDDFTNVSEQSRRLVAGEDVLPGDPTWVFGTFPGPDWLRPIEPIKALPFDDEPLRAWVQPFNPCLPDAGSRTCPRYPPVQDPYPPFNSETPVFNVYN